MSDPSGSKSKLDPKFRERLLKESRNPWRGLRRGLWIALFGSALIGFLIMSSKVLSGDIVLLNDVGIQIGSLLLFGGFLWLDRPREK